MAKLSDNIMTEIKEVVSIFDRVGDGKIDVNDIVNILRSLDLNPGSHDWDAEMKQFQKDDKFRIEVDEFASIYEQESKKKKVNEKEIYEALKAVDPHNKDIGLVNRAALSRYLCNLGDTMSMEETDSIMKDVMDKDHRSVVIADLMKLVMTE
ncbi:uncharacterized protein [Clytia hemisphaerica]|uniref:EF-hand domain-containing protein n=1 Tax=Clytia hemisphaerica TaxID=252671 RepID=A0A7M5UTP1_9CNID|eukprot:TCONS_00007299-protein